MSIYNFVNPDNGQTIVVKGPATLTREQALKIFEEQRAAGALVSLQPGQSITAETQLAAGLVSAQAEVLQSISRVPGVFNKPSPDKVIIDALVSVPTTAGTVTTGEYAVQQPTSTTIEKLTNVEMTSVLAQYKKLIDQPADVATNKGVGEFGLTPEQLEAQGYLKPGTVNTFLSTNQNTLLTVLKSPQVWTGKDNILGIKDLLKNKLLQQTIQEQAMTTGFNDLAEVGLPVQELPARAQAGLALSAALNPRMAEQWLKSQVIAPDLKSKFNDFVRYGAFAVDFADTKINDSLKREQKGRGYVGTTSREQINAAVTRVIGNKKITIPPFGQPSTDPQLQLEYDTLSDEYRALFDRQASIQQQSIFVQNIDVRESQTIAIDTQILALKAKVQNLQLRLQQTVPLPQTLLDNVVILLQDIEALIGNTQSLLALIKRIKAQYQIR